MRLLILLLISSRVYGQSYNKITINSNTYNKYTTVTRSGDSVLIDSEDYQETYVLVYGNMYRQISKLKFERESISFITFGETMTINQFYKNFHLKTVYENNCMHLRAVPSYQEQAKESEAQGAYKETAE